MRSENNTVNEEYNLWHEPSVEGVQHVANEREDAIHRGMHYEGYDYDDDVGDGVDKYWLFIPPVAASGCRPHVGFDVSVSNASRVRIYENPTINGNGVALPIRNSDRELPDIPKEHFFRDPQNVSEGDIKLFDTQVGGGAIVNAGGVAGNRAGIIVRNGAKYLLRVTPQAAATRVSVTTLFIRHDETQAPCDP